MSLNPQQQPRSGLVALAGPVALGLGAVMAPLILAPSLNTVLATYIFLGISLLTFMTARHIQILRNRPRVDILKRPNRQIRIRALNYHLFVLGSGGHTKEMLMMMDDGFCNFANFHRRYLISSGDRMSENHLEEYEADLRSLCESEGQQPGTFDKRTVTRARKVHQPLWSTPLTALLSIMDIFPILLSPPDNEVGRKLGYPTHIFSNGPATGFFAGLAVHLLKVFYVVPENVMTFVYIESWARISTLSLTGKLFHYTNLADVFLVQHENVAQKYGIGNAGEMVFNSKRPA